MNKHEEVKIVMLVSWDRLYLMNVLVARQLHYSQKDKFIAISQQEYEESKTYLNEHDIYCLDELLNTEKELEEEKKQHQYDNKYMNEVVKGLTDKTLEVVKRKRDYEIQRANEFDNSMFPPNFYWEHQGAVNVLNSIIAEIEGDK